MNLVKVKGVWLNKTKTAYILDRIEYISGVNVKPVNACFWEKCPDSAVPTKFFTLCSEILILESTNFLDAFLWLSGCTSNKTIPN
jgi:hypothetical protein